MEISDVAGKIPDSWYDIYVRLLPGSYFMLCMFLIGNNNLFDLSWQQMIVILAVGYLFGHMTQPLSAKLAYFVQRFNGIEMRYYDALNVVPYTSRESFIISKQYAESVSMSAFAILNFLLSLICFGGEKINQIVPWFRFGLPSGTGYIFLLFAFLSTLFSIERSTALNRRCIEFLKKPPANKTIVTKQGQGSSKGQRLT
jgi:hypothetical protein